MNTFSSMSGKLNRFPKSVRLHFRKEIDELFSSGKSIKAFPIRAIYKFMPLSDVSVQVAMSVPKRYIKLAVNRNRIKRQMREIFRLNCHQTMQHFTSKGKRVQVMLIYTGKESPEYAVLETKIILILQRLQEADELGVV